MGYVSERAAWREKSPFVPLKILNPSICILLGSLSLGSGRQANWFLFTPFINKDLLGSNRVPGISGYQDMA